MNRSVFITLNLASRQLPAGKEWTGREFVLTPADTAVNARAASSIESFVSFDDLAPGTYSLTAVDLAGREPIGEPVTGEIIVPAIDGPGTGGTYMAVVGFSYLVR